MTKVIVENQELLDKVRENNNNCLCALEQVKCMCVDFLDSEDEVCHCGVFRKVKEEK